MIVRYLMMLMPYVGDPWEEHDFDDMPQTGLHAETGLGNDNHTAGLTVLNLWAFMRPYFEGNLQRTRQQGMIEVYFFMAFVYIKMYNTTRAFGKWFTWSAQFKQVSYYTFLNVIRPMIYMMAHFLDEIRWDALLLCSCQRQWRHTGSLVGNGEKIGDQLGDREVDGVANSKFTNSDWPKVPAQRPGCCIMRYSEMERSKRNRPP
jgi:hypothetical protein